MTIGCVHVSTEDGGYANEIERVRVIGDRMWWYDATTEATSGIGIAVSIGVGMGIDIAIEIGVGTW